MTRGMLVTVLYRLEGTPEVTGENPFTDVADDAYYKDAIIWAATNEIVGGSGDGTYNPDSNITRQDFATILYRYAQLKEYDVTVTEEQQELTYADADDISEYALNAVQWATAKEILTGKAGEMLDPVGNATRAEVAAMLMRFNEAYNPTAENPTTPDDTETPATPEEPTTPETPETETPAETEPAA